MDLWISGGECRKHRASASDAEASESFADLDRSLDYVRQRRPGVAIVENVCDRRLSEWMAATVGRIGGYRWRVARLDPARDCGGVMDRDRSYWVGVATA